MLRVRSAIAHDLCVQPVRIEMLGQACMAIRTGEHEVVTDPWFSGPSHLGSWRAYPELDPPAVERMRARIDRATHVYISHDLTTVEHICHRVAVMYLGSIVEIGTKEQVFNASQHPYSKALLSSALIPDPTVRKSLYLLSGEIPSPINLPAGCPLHTRCPEAIDACRECFPPFVDVGDGHLAACIWARPANGVVLDRTAEASSVAS